jgi:hypothetical protein
MDSVNWFVTLRHPKEIWELHASYLITEVAFYFLGLLTFCHACRSGGRYVYLWFTTILHGLVVESLSYFVPDIDNFWHAQSMVMFLGQRLPLHIVLLYPVFIYTATATVSRLKLKACAEACAAGLCVVLIDIPFDIVGVKHLFWTWHDTDPNIFDRHYYVPWTSYYFHAAFASSFTLLFHGTRSLIGHGGDPATKMEADGFVKETFCSLVTGILAMPLGIMQFIPIYHPLHDMFHVHSEVCVLMFLALYFLIAWTADRSVVKETSHGSMLSGTFDELRLLVLIHFVIYVIFAITGQPEFIRSVGHHQPTGNCSHITPVQAPTGQVLSKQTYLCTSKFDEPYFDFHCVAGGKVPADGLSWYEICGTPFTNHIEHIIVVSALSVFGFWVYRQLLDSGRQPGGYAVKAGRRKTD